MNRDTYSYHHPSNKLRRPLWEKLHLDPILLGGLCILIAVGSVILYSADGASLNILFKQGLRLGAAFIVMLVFAQIPPRKYYQWAPWVFAFGTVLLIATLIIGHTGKGAQRWLGLGAIKFQPSEIMKLAVPMMLAWYFHDKQLPPSLGTLFVASIVLIVPVGLTAIQPDLGTAIIIACCGAAVFVLAGLSWRIIFSLGILALCSFPVLWHFFMHDYQRERVLTFINPERDPLGSGYHIIQSKIAIGSGGVFGKGWLNGTQSHLQFLPEHATDFIFAVTGEEFGLIGGITLITLFLILVLRGLRISTLAQDTFSRLLAGSISLMFFISFFVNIGMVSGILPVVGLPLPLVSYGGTSMVTILAGFGIIMSIFTHRKLLGR
ncbi:MAG: rod shape-determining protein RodA [Gammaproteobacteria bacterium]|nr:rod shape-determining protein RodA [Gammaproteobacteria bacterium]